MITIFLSLIKKIPWQLWLLSGVMISFWLYGSWQFNRGQQENQNRWNIAIERGKVIVEALKKQTGKVNTVVETKYVDRVKVIREKAKIITKEIPIYIPVDSPDLPGGFRLLHDAATNSTVPDSSLIPDAAPVSVATATETIVTNYETCQIWRSQLIGWQEWYQEQALVWQTAQHK